MALALILLLTKSKTSRGRKILTRVRRTQTAGFVNIFAEHAERRSIGRWSFAPALSAWHTEPSRAKSRYRQSPLFGRITKRLGLRCPLNSQSLRAKISLRRGGRAKWTALASLSAFLARQFAAFLSLTPAPPPFSAMNSTPAGYPAATPCSSRVAVPEVVTRECLSERPATLQFCRRPYA
jgi:hypothetical protein